MARERYLLEDTEDTIHNNQIVPTTFQEKWDNWWFYHRNHVSWGILGVIFLAVVIYSFASRVEPDYQLALMTEYVVPEDLRQDIESCLQQYADDRNGDGQAVVRLQYYHFPKKATSEVEAAEQQSSFVRFSADASDGDSMIYLYDDYSYLYLGKEDMDEFLTPVNGHEEPYVLFSEMEGMNGMPLVKYTEEGVDYDRVMEILGKLKVSMRVPEGIAFEGKGEDSEIQQYWEASCAFMERLETGTKPEPAA